MKEKFVLCPGKICTLDKDNTLKQDEHGTIFVEIVREVPRKKIFGPRLFEIIGAGDDKVKMLNPIIVPETLLSPEGNFISLSRKYKAISSFDKLFILFPFLS